jgi:hypothetical protein
LSAGPLKSAARSRPVPKTARLLSSRSGFNAPGGAACGASPSVGGGGGDTAGGEIGLRTVGAGEVAVICGGVLLLGQLPIRYKPAHSASHSKITRIRGLGLRLARVPCGSASARSRKGPRITVGKIRRRRSIVERYQKKVVQAPIQK